MNESLDLKQILRILVKRLWIIVLCLIIGGLGAFSITKFLMTPQYTSSATMYVNNRTKTDNVDIISGSDLVTSQKLISTYSQIAQTPEVIDQVIRKLKLDMTVGQVRSMLSFGAVGETEIMRITATSEDPELAANLANAVTEFAPAMIKSVIGIGEDTVSVLETAKPSSVPSSPSTAKNTLIGALAGAVIAVLIVLLMEMFDTTVRGEEDVAAHYSIPVLTCIPELESTTKKGKYAYEYKS